MQPSARSLPVFSFILLLAGCGGQSDSWTGSPPFRKLVDETHGQVRLTVFRLGLEAEASKNEVRGRGLTLALEHREHGQVYLAGWRPGERARRVDFSSASVGLFRITHLTHDPRFGVNEDNAPLALESVRVLPDGRCAREFELLLTPEPAAPEMIASLVERGLRALAAGQDRDFVRALAHLRNMALEDPKPVLAAYRCFYGRAQGADAERLTDFEQEVELVRHVLAQKSIAAAAQR